MAENPFLSLHTERKLLVQESAKSPELIRQTDEKKYVQVRHDDPSSLDECTAKNAFSRMSGFDYTQLNHALSKKARVFEKNINKTSVSAKQLPRIL